MNDLPEKLAAIEALEQAATPGPWGPSLGATSDGSEYVTTHEQKAAFLALSLNDDESRLWLVVSDAVIPAATGDGPNAEANAAFIAASREAVPFLLALVREQATKLDKVEALCAVAARRGVESGPPLELTAIRSALGDKA